MGKNYSSKIQYLNKINALVAFSHIRYLISNHQPPVVNVTTFIAIHFPVKLIILKCKHYMTVFWFTSNYFIFYLLTYSAMAAEL